MHKYASILLKFLRILALSIFTYILFNSAFDLYNDFAYDRAILKDSPYGYTPILQDPKDYSSMNSELRSGEYVYVVDWLSAYNTRVVFAKVKSKFKEGYVNKDLLVQANMNVNPVVSSMLLLMIFIFSAIKAYKKFSST